MARRTVFLHIDATRDELVERVSEALETEAERALWAKRCTALANAQYPFERTRLEADIVFDIFVIPGRTRDLSCRK